jgi:predicted aspartyl protease
MDGFFSQNGHPIIPIEVYGFSKDIAQKFEAMLDTGFSGFLSLPLVYALKVGLILNSTASFVLADGSVQHTLLCLGTIRLDGEEKIGLISISKGNDALLGMDFLRKFNKRLHLDCGNNIVRLENAQKGSG